MAMIKHLFYKPANDNKYLETDQLIVSTSGIEGAYSHHTWRQLLLIPSSVLKSYDLVPGQLKENIVAESPFDLHELPSGTTLKVGSVIVRLTFHCEPCAKLKPFIAPNKLLHQRGYHAQIIKAGKITIGDEISQLNDQYEPIPYAASDRIKWFLQTNPTPIFAAELVKNLGLPASYCRALPSIIKKHPEIDSRLVLYKKDS